MKNYYLITSPLIKYDMICMSYNNKFYNIASKDKGRNEGYYKFNPPLPIECERDFILSVNVSPLTEEKYLEIIK